MTLVLSTKTLYKNAGKNLAWWQVVAEQLPDGSARLLITYAKSESGVPVEKLHPVKGMNIGKANETSPATQAIAEAESRWKKQLDKGYVESKEEAAVPATNSLGLAMPQLSTPLEKVGEENIDWENAFLQPKLDGHRSLYKEIVYSRQGKAQNVAHIQKAIAECPALAALHLDGELYIHGDYSLQQLGSLIKKPQEESLKLEYWIYDIVSNQPFEDRYAALCGAFGESTPDVRLKLVPTYRVRSMKEALERHADFVKDEFEGSVLRHDLAGYQDGKRSRNSVKIKDFTDAEYPVIGYELGTPSVIDGETLQVPVFIYEVKPGLTGKVTTMGDAKEKHAEYLALTRGENTNRRLLTLKHFGFTDDGVPNIATAKCWKEDV